jgi:starch synthase
MRIAHLAAEVSPFARTGGLGDVVAALAMAQHPFGHDVTVWMPLYRQAREEIAQRGYSTEFVTDPFTLQVGHLRFQVGLLRTSLPSSNVPLYLVGQDELFNRQQIYGRDPHGRDDGLLRYSVFVNAVFEVMRRLQLVPDLIHAHDWHATLAPMALAWRRPQDPLFRKTSTVLTVHNLAYQGIYDPREYAYLNLPPERAPAAQWLGRLNLMKGGLLTADAITAVSPTFAQEIATPEGGFGLDPIVRTRSAALHGFLNGVDTNLWNPETDGKIPYRYRRGDLAGKAENRRTLLTMAGMDAADPRMVIGVVGRLTEQKGYDLLFPVLDELMREGLRFVMLGTGERWLENAVQAYTHRARGRFWGHVGFDDPLSHLIEAGADAFLMPSRFEPCGLNQMYSLLYGTPPIVRRVGGLVDTVITYDGTNREEATGFGFDASVPHALRDAVRWAEQCFADKALWSQLVDNGMARDFSWKRSAEGYVELYERLRRAKQGS